MRPARAGMRWTETAALPSAPPLTCSTPARLGATIPARAAPARSTSIATGRSPEGQIAWNWRPGSTRPHPDRDGPAGPIALPDQGESRLDGSEFHDAVGQDRGEAGADIDERNAPERSAVRHPVLDSREIGRLGPSVRKTRIDHDAVHVMVVRVGKHDEFCLVGLPFRPQVGIDNPMA